MRTGTPNSLSLWQELFLILGALTFGLGCFLFFFMPSSPATTKYLTSKERAIAIERIRTNKTGINNRHFKREQLIEAVKDPRLYLFVIMIMASTVTNGCELLMSTMKVALTYPSADTTFSVLQMSDLRHSDYPRLWVQQREDSFVCGGSSLSENYAAADVLNWTKDWAWRLVRPSSCPLRLLWALPF